MSLGRSQGFCRMLMGCVGYLILCLGMLEIFAVSSHAVDYLPTAHNPEDNSGNPNPNITPNPSPYPSATPTPSPTPPPQCIEGTEERTINGKVVCVPIICLSNPRYSLFITCDANGVCTCEDACKLSPVYQMSIVRLNSRWGTPSYRPLASGSYPQCLRQIASRCGNRWSTEIAGVGFEGYVRGNRGVWYYDMYGYRYVPNTGSSPYLPNSSFRVSSPDGWSVYGTDECVVAMVGGRNDVSSMSVLLDKNCKPLQSSPYLCGLSGTIHHDVATWPVAVSPVSLILDSREKIGDASNLVQFPLDNSKTGKWYAWKASSDTPLIVFDPRHEGKIDNATQLFGNFTFGKSWSNGYEALASLDKDSDSKLSAMELADLGLWFDRNRDGVSQPGEVEDIRAAGITALYVKPDSQEAGSKDLYVTHGFDRLVNGRTLKGASVDWFVTEYQSKTEGLLKEQEKSANINSPQDTSIPNISKLKRAAINESQKQFSRISFTGSWIWKTAESTAEGRVLTQGEGENVPTGLLTFVEQEGQLSGHSLVEIAKPKNSANIGSEVMMYALNGKVDHTNPESPKITFSVKAENGLETVSSAELSSDGRWLIGQSKMQIGRDGEGGPIFIDYLWKGERVENDN